MELVPITENTLINIDLIEAVEVRKVRGEKLFTVVIGGKSYTPTVDTRELLSLLIKHGGTSVVNQYFSV